MRNIVVVIVLLATPTSAADFRVLDVGEPCASVRDSEVAIGSRPMTWSGISPYVYAFQIQEFGREIELSYFCPHARLVRRGSGSIDLLDDALVPLNATTRK